MKIAVSAKGTELGSPVDPRFGRAPYLLIVDSVSGGIVEVIDNRPAADAAQGAGINAAGRIAEAGATAILTGVVGPKAAAVCQQAGIAMQNGAEGTVAEAVGHFLRGVAGISPTAHAETTGSGPRPAATGRGMGPGAGRRAGMGHGGCGCGRGRDRS